MMSGINRQELDGFRTSTGVKTPSGQVSHCGHRSPMLSSPISFLPSSLAVLAILISREIQRRCSWRAIYAQAEQGRRDRQSSTASFARQRREECAVDDNSSSTSFCLLLVEKCRLTRSVPSVYTVVASSGFAASNAFASGLWSPVSRIFDESRSAKPVPAVHSNACLGPAFLGHRVTRGSVTHAWVPNRKDGARPWLLSTFHKRPLPFRVPLAFARRHGQFLRIEIFASCQPVLTAATWASFLAAPGFCLFQG